MYPYYAEVLGGNPHISSDDFFGFGRPSGMFLIDVSCHSLEQQIDFTRKVAGSKGVFGMAAIPGGDATKAEVHSCKSIDYLPLTQRNLPHKCSAITQMTPSCSKFRRLKEIDE